MRRGGRGGGRCRGAAGRGAPASPLRHRRQRGLGCWTSVRRGNRRIRGGILPVSLQSEFAEIAARDGRAALVTVIAGPSLGAKLLVCADGSSQGGLGSPELDSAGVEAAEELLWAERSETREAGEATLFVDVVAPAPRLIVFGAVDYAAALCRLAPAAGGPPFVSRSRSEFAT